MGLIGNIGTTQAIYGSTPPEDVIGEDGDLFVYSVGSVVLGIFKKESGTWNEIGDVNPPDWVPFTPPTVFSLTGTITTIGVTDCKYKLIGKTCHILMQVEIVTNGTGGGAVVVGRPAFLQASAHAIIAGEQFTTVAKSCVVDIPNTLVNAYFYLYDGTYPGGDNTTLHGSGFFDIQ